MIVPRDQNAVRSHNIKTDNCSLERNEVFKFRKKLREVWSQVTLAIFRCKLFCLPGFFSKNIKIKTYRNIIFRFVLYICNNSSLILSEEHSPNLCEDRVFRKMFLPNRSRWIWSEESNLSGLVICIHYQIFFGLLNQEERIVTSK